MIITRGCHIGPTAPTSLNGENNFEIELPKSQRISIQAALFSNPSYVVNFRVAKTSGLTATALDSSEGFISNGGVVELELNPQQQAYLYVLITDMSGAAQSGGANDYLNKWVVAV